MIEMAHESSGRTWKGWQWLGRLIALGAIAVGLASGTATAAPEDAGVGSGSEIADAGPGSGAGSGNAVQQEGTPRPLKTATTPSNPFAVDGAFKILIMMFVLALLLEQGLSVIFNWRVFLQIFDGRGVKTVISVVSAFVLLWVFKLDLVAELIQAYRATADLSNTFTRFLTAMVLAGGSSGVNNLLVMLQFRSAKTAEQLVPKPPPTKAWIAVRLARKDALGEVLVAIGPIGSVPPVAGIILGSSNDRARTNYFLVDRGRFPMVGGYELTPDAGTQYVVVVEGKAASGTALTKTWGPYPIAPGAIIDIVLTL